MTMELPIPGRSLPTLTDLNRFFWTGGADGVLRFLRCEACSVWVHPPSPVCPQCLKSSLRPQPVSGKGRVEAVTINHQSWIPGLPVPYVIAIVSIDEDRGVRLTTNIVGEGAMDAAIGQPVRVRFEQHEDVWLPLFEPA